MCSVIFSHMNARATLSNGRRVKENGGGKVGVRATRDSSEEVLEILEMCAKYKDNGRENLQRNPKHNQQLQVNTFVLRYTINPCFNRINTLLFPNRFSRYVMFLHIAHFHQCFLHVFHIKYRWER
jgi:hypothetical protein